MSIELVLSVASFIAVAILSIILDTIHKRARNLDRDFKELERRFEHAKLTGLETRNRIDADIDALATYLRVERKVRDEKRVVEFVKYPQFPMGDPNLEGRNGV
jgi:hypothetical protein